MYQPYYKRYIQRLRWLELEEIHLHVIDDVSPVLKNYMKRILETEFRDGFIHAYYGKIKDCIGAFDRHWSETIDKAIINTDKYCHINEKDDALAFIENSISQQVAKQVAFGKEYIPMKSIEEKEMYERIHAKYQLYIKGLNEVKEAVQKLPHKYFPAPIIRDKVENTVKKLGEMFEFTHTYIAFALADCLYIIRSSLEDVAVHVRHNLRTLQATQSRRVRQLVQHLFDCNKRVMELERRDPDNQLDRAQTKHSAKLASQRLEDYRQSQVENLRKVTDQLNMWEGRIRDFEPIARVLRALKKELENTVKELKTYEGKRCLELPGSKADAWELIGKNLYQRKEFLNENIKHAAKSLMTFFHVRGPTMELHEAEGEWPFFYDEYGHQVYHLDQGLRHCHVTCEGGLIEIPRHDDMFKHDDFGQYREENGQRIYQRSNCGSSYKLDSHENLFNRISIDCDHSADDARWDTKFRNHATLTAGQVQPEQSKPDDGKLDPETTKYIWDTFGYILPEALCEVAKVKPADPMKYLGNRLLKLHYSWTRDEIAKRKKISAKFRQDILDARKQKLVEATLAARAKHRARDRQWFADVDATMSHATTRAAHLWVLSMDQQ